MEVQPHELLYFFFEGMLMGWSWVLYFAQAAMETPFEKALGKPSNGIGGLLRDGKPFPLIGPAALWALSTSTMAPPLQLPVQTAKQEMLQ